MQKAFINYQWTGENKFGNQSLELKEVLRSTAKLNHLKVSGFALQSVLKSPI